MRLSYSSTIVHSNSEACFSEQLLEIDNFKSYFDVGDYIKITFKIITDFLSTIFNRHIWTFLTVFHLF